MEHTFACFVFDVSIALWAFVFHVVGVKRTSRIFWYEASNLPADLVATRRYAVVVVLPDPYCARPHPPPHSPPAHVRFPVI